MGGDPNYLLTEMILQILVINGVIRSIFRGENYFTSSDPHHDMSGGGCQVRVVIYF